LAAFVAHSPDEPTTMDWKSFHQCRITAVVTEPLAGAALFAGPALQADPIPFTSRAHGPERAHTVISLEMCGSIILHAPA
jgi:hypothetical protein